MPNSVFLLRAKIAALLVFSALPSVALAHADHVSKEVEVAVSDPARSEANRKLDESRKPGEVLSFLGLKQGMTAADIMTGAGYWVEIMGNAVGPQGKVIGFEPEQFYSAEQAKPVWDAMIAREPNISMALYPFDAFSAAESSLDFTIINLSYHDLYWESEKFKIPRTDPAAFVKALYAATKPGGIVGIIDHVGNAGDTRQTVDALHRIDPAVVRTDFEDAGFVLAGTSEVLANPEDDHSKLVFDPSIRGKTDRFVFRFRKPG